MNLFINPSLSDLYQLICKAKNTTPIHDLVVDYDGEVLIDPQLEQPELQPKKFKFHLQFNELTKKAILTGSNNLKALYNNLKNAWDNETDVLLNALN